MTLPQFQLLNPTTISEAVTELKDRGDGARVYAGGAQILLLLRLGLVHADYLVNIKGIPSLDRLGWDGESVDIGAIATHRRLAADPVIRSRLPMLAFAESQVGNIRVRNQGTLLGNLCHADPQSDPATALLAYDASVQITGSNGHDRRLPMAGFITDAYETVLAPGELLSGVSVPPLPPGWGEAYVRIEGSYRPTAGVAVAVHSASGSIDGIRLAAGCIGPVPRRLPELELQVLGLRVEEALRVLARSQSYITQRLEPLDDILGSPAYKAHITAVLLGRALEQALQAQGQEASANGNA